MSALDSGQFAAGEVWINSGAASGVFGAGNDTTGTGTSAAPYATLDEAMAQWRISEGAAPLTKQVTFRMLTDSASSQSSYAQFDRGADNTTYHETSSPAFYTIIEGWDTTWGDTTKGVWTDIDLKPIWGGFQNTGTPDQGIRLIKTEDLSFESDTTKIVDQNCTSLGDAINYVSYGCRYSRISSTDLFKFEADGIESNFNFHACTFDVGYSTINNTSSNAPKFANCYINNGGTGDCFEIFSNSGAGNISTVNILNSIFVCSGAGFLCYDNGIGNIDPSTLTSMTRTGNTYNIIDGASFSEWSDTSGVLSAFASAGVQDTESQEVDPIFVSDGDPALANASPILDKGMALGGVWLTDLTDPTGNSSEDVDALRAKWGDEIDPTNTATSNGETVWSHRSPGPIQQILSNNPTASELLFSVGIVGVSSIYVAAEVGLDFDGIGTCHFRLLQADNAAGTSGLITVDSAPIEVNINNKFIDIIEDSGSEVNVSLTESTYTTLELMTEIETQLNAAGLTGTYTVSYNTSTGITTISATGLSSGFEMLWATGTNSSDSIAVLIGFTSSDSAQTTSLDSDQAVDQNLFDSSLTWELSRDYTPGEDPATSGAWSDIGTGQPTDDGTDEGTNGVRCDGVGGTVFVRIDIGTISNTDQKFHGFQAWNGNTATIDAAL